MRVTVVVVHWNSLADLPGCLEALGTVPGLEIVVADNASPDDGEDLVRRRFPAVRWLALARNAGFGAAVNAGAAATRSTWILALNPDTTVMGQDLLAMVAAGEDLGAAALGPRMLDRAGRVELSYGTRDSLLGDLKWLLAWRGARMWKLAASPREVSWVTGACLLVRREAFERVGGFDEEYFLYFEDADLCRRLRLRGGRVIYHPGFSVVHRRGASGRGQAARVRLAYRQSQLRFVSLHRPAYYERFVRWSLGVRAWLWRGPWSPADVRHCGAALGDTLRITGARR